ncbi:hypothetical protein LINPERPRIM_LOCUS6926, partial [Linum perenne]
MNSHLKPSLNTFLQHKFERKREAMKREEEEIGEGWKKSEDCRELTDRPPWERNWLISGWPG